VGHPDRAPACNRHKKRQEREKGGEEATNGSIWEWGRVVVDKTGVLDLA